MKFFNFFFNNSFYKGPNLYSKKYILDDLYFTKIRNKKMIFNLTQLLISVKKSLNFIKKIIFLNGNILFINENSPNSKLLLNKIKLINEFWIFSNNYFMGTFTNYWQVRNNYKLFENNLPKRLPDLIILFNLNDLKHSSLILEANEKNIPIISIVPINSINLKKITYPIIINNDEKIFYLNYFFFNLICEFIYFFKNKILKNSNKLKQYNYSNQNLVKYYKKTDLIKKKYIKKIYLFKFFKKFFKKSYQKNSIFSKFFRKKFIRCIKKYKFRKRKVRLKKIFFKKNLHMNLKKYKNQKKFFFWYSIKFWKNFFFNNLKSNNLKLLTLTLNDFYLKYFYWKKINLSLKLKNKNTKKDVIYDLYLILKNYFFFIINISSNEKKLIQKLIILYLKKILWIKKLFSYYFLYYDNTEKQILNNNRIMLIKWYKDIIFWENWILNTYIKWKYYNNNNNIKISWNNFILNTSNRKYKYKKFK